MLIKLLSLLNIKQENKNILKYEKWIIIILLLILYLLIILIFTYFTWKECTNIIDSLSINTYKFLHREKDLCNSIDVLLIIYLVFLFLSIGLNIILGIGYHYYSNYKNKKIIKNDNKIIIHIPLYNESYETIKSTIDSITKLNYNLDNILLLIIIDGIIPNEKNKTTDYILLNKIFENSEYIYDCIHDILYKYHLISYKNNTLKIYNGTYNNIQYSTIIKCGNNLEKHNFNCGNRGKKDSALIIYDMMNHLNEYFTTYSSITNRIDYDLQYKLNEYEYLLILDCDTDIETNGLNILLKNIKNDNNCIAVCGQTLIKNKNENFITFIQNFEYFITHLLLKSFESVIYNTLVLSGCFTLLKLHDNNKPIINQNIIDEYTKTGNTLIEKNLLELGEDRYLTSLLIKEYPDKKIKYIPNAICYTTVPNTFKILLDQRRRWTNSLIACLIFLFTNPPKQNIIKKIKLYFILIIELNIIFILPITIIIGLLNTILNLTIQGYSLQTLIITLILLLLNAIITILVLKFEKLIYFIPYMISLPIFSIIIPLYSIFKLDNLKWGLTRDYQEIKTPRDSEAVFL